MLRLTRKVGQEICLYDENEELMFTISVQNIRYGQVSIGIDSDPSKTKIKRKETVGKDENND